MSVPPPVAANSIQTAAECSESSTKTEAEYEKNSKLAPRVASEAAGGATNPKAEAQCVATKVQGNVPVEEDREHAQYFSSWGERQARHGYKRETLSIYVL